LEPELRQLINIFQGSLNALEALNPQPSIQDVILNELLLSQVENNIRIEFENKHVQQIAVGFKDLLSF
jgi:hypothetical protein